MIPNANMTRTVNLVIFDTPHPNTNNTNFTSSELSASTLNNFEFMPLEQSRWMSH